MSLPPQKPTTTPIPVRLSENDFTTFILPHLSMPQRGPKCKLGYHRLFNLILWVLYTGMQWKCLPIPTDAQGKPAIHYTTVYRVVYLSPADNSLRLTRRLSQGLKVLDEWALMTSQQPSEPW